jgi:hypothetical protein
MLFKNPVRTSERTPHFTITTINWLTLFKFKYYNPMEYSLSWEISSQEISCLSWDSLVPMFTRGGDRGSWIQFSRSFRLASLLTACRSRWPRRLRRWSSAAWLLESRVRIPLTSWMFVSCVHMLCCHEVSATGWSLVQRSPTVCLIVCD